MYKRIRSYINAAKVKQYRNTSKNAVFVLTEKELIELISNFPKAEKDIVENLTVFIAQQIVDMVDNEDWSPAYICDHAKSEWPQLGLKASNAFIGGILIKNSRKIIKRNE